jgi:hypothetical protein
MPTARVIEAVDVLEDGCLSLSAGFPGAAPDQLGLDGFEEGLDGGVEAPMFVKLAVRALSACTAR